MTARDTLEWLRAEAAAGRLSELPVADLPLHAGAHRTVRWAGCETVAELLAADELAFYRQPGCGVVTLRSIRAMREVLQTLLGVTP